MTTLPLPPLAHQTPRPAGTPARPVASPRPVLFRRSRLVALAVGGFLVPWCVLLATTLPASTQVQHWSVAWTGLDAGEAVAALATALLLARADARAALTAVAGGTLLIADAWFDVCTSAPGLDHGLAVADALFAELPLAGAAFWVAARLMRAARNPQNTAAPGNPGRLVLPSGTRVSARR